MFIIINTYKVISSIIFYFNYLLQKTTGSAKPGHVGFKVDKLKKNNFT